MDFEAQPAISANAMNDAASDPHANCLSMCLPSHFEAQVCDSFMTFPGCCYWR